MITYTEHPDFEDDDDNHDTSVPINNGIGILFLLILLWGLLKIKRNVDK